MADPGRLDGADEAATGFWRLARPEGAKPCLVSPEGLPRFLLGVDTVMRDIQAGGVTRCAGIAEYLRRDEPTATARFEWERLTEFGFNSVGAFSDTNDFDDSGGDSYMIRAPEDGGAGAPYAIALNVSAQGDDRALKGDDGTVLKTGFSARRVGDPFNPAFASDLDALVPQIAARRDDPGLQMWFAGNELGIFDVAGHGDGGVRDLRRWLWSDVPAGSSTDEPLCARHALAAFLARRYDGSIDALNAGWDSLYDDFAEIVEAGPHPVPYEHDCNDRALQDLQCFVHDVLLPAWVGAVTRCIRAADPNHLVASPRLALASSNAYRFWAGASQPDPDHWAEPPEALVGDDTAQVRYSPFDVLGADDGFDLVAVNVYSGRTAFPDPWFASGIDKLGTASGLPVLISEFGIRARIDGWSGRGGAGAFVPSVDPTADQIERGKRYGSQLDQFIAQPAVVGACWHAWCDRFGADPAAQINMGLVQCTDAANGLEAGRPWEDMVELVRERNQAISGQA